MNKTERQLAITLELQRTKLIRAEDLAAQFETSVRTIYRDIQALSEAGVPIAGAPGHGYSLMEGYFLPRLVLLRRKPCRCSWGEVYRTEMGYRLWYSGQVCTAQD